MLSRRNFIRKTAATAAGLSIAGAIPSVIAKPNKIKLPKPKNSGIEHIIVVTMENRSFDHFLGWLPGADGKQAGLSYTDRNGAVHPTYSLGTDFTGCGHADPTHGYNDSRTAYDGGRMDGFLRAGSNDVFAI